MQIPKPSEGGSFELTPAGTFVATCYRFIDRGTHVTDFNGDKKTRHEVMLSWEIADEIMADGRPFTISKVYTWSMHEKAGLRKDLESWRGRSFEEKDFEGPDAFDTRKLLGASCMLTIVHITKGDKTFANIASIGKLVKGMKAPPVVNPIAYLALTKDGWSPEVYSSLSDKMREIISASPEYKELQTRNMQPDDPRAGYDPTDDIPF